VFGFVLKALFGINYLTKVHSIHNCSYLHLDDEQLIVFSRCFMCVLLFAVDLYWRRWGTLGLISPSHSWSCKDVKRRLEEALFFFKMSLSWGRERARGGKVVSASVLLIPWHYKTMEPWSNCTKECFLWFARHCTHKSLQTGCY